MVFGVAVSGDDRGDRVLYVFDGMVSTRCWCTSFPGLPSNGFVVLLYCSVFCVYFCVTVWWSWIFCLSWSLVTSLRGGTGSGVVSSGTASMVVLSMVRAFDMSMLS